MLVYLAGPLFSKAERAYNELIGSALEQAGYQVIMPYTLLTDEDIQAAGEDAPGLIFGTCLKHLSLAGSVVAILDGPQVDDGTAWEIGYAYGQGKKIFGIRTDGRRAGETECSVVNSMIQGSIEEIVKDLPALLRVLKKFEIEFSKE
ncbi:MAG: nucleoside 2-deoxyribosyltransferase [Desulfovibrio sp.]|jgi:nucleoside 2-deoxyribosyltransferase|nr:nucleoside 2-deoxyribosyltransferase [Desulfovibrio sp.]